MAQPKKNNKSFEEALQELETVVSRLEAGELGLEESLQLYEQGVALIRHCTGKLESARLKLEELKAGDADEETV